MSRSRSAPLRVLSFPASSGARHRALSTKDVRPSMRLLGVLSLVAWMGLGCGACQRPAPAPEPSEAPTTPSADGTETAEVEPGSGADAGAAAGDLEAFGDSVNAFAAPLMEQLAKAPGNLTFSPASVELALAMTAMGAGGETQAELLRVLHLEPSALGGLGAILGEWNDPAKQTARLQISNAVFTDTRFSLAPEYTARLTGAFGEVVKPLDFHAPEPARKAINEWIAGQTEGRIQELIGEGQVGPETPMVLVNTVYLNAEWEVPFKERDTKPAPFTLASGQKVEVQTMSRTGRMTSGEIGGARVIELPYKGGALAMRFILPPEGSAPEAWVNAAHLSATDALLLEDVILELPRFKIDGPTLALAEALQSLGIQRAFSRTEADFTPMGAPQGGPGLFIGRVAHRAFIRVDEAGTEAAAATGIVMEVTSLLDTSRHRVVRFDRPFLFQLRDVRTGATLFLGRVDDPR